MAFNLRETQPARAESIVRTLEDALARATNAEGRTQAIEGIGNAGLASSLSVLVPFLRSPNIAKRCQGLGALRLVNSSEAEAILLSALASREPLDIRRAAMDAFGDRPVTPVVKDVLMEQILLEDEHSLIVKALSILADAVDTYPEIETFIQTLSKNASTEKLKKHAQELLGDL